MQLARKVWLFSCIIWNAFILDYSNCTILTDKDLGKRDEFKTLIYPSKDIHNVVITFGYFSEVKLFKWQSNLGQPLSQPHDTDLALLDGLPRTHHFGRFDPFWLAGTPCFLFFLPQYRFICFGPELDPDQGLPCISSTLRYSRMRRQQIRWSVRSEHDRGGAQDRTLESFSAGVLLCSD